MTAVHIAVKYLLTISGKDNGGPVVAVQVDYICQAVVVGVDTQSV